MRGTRAQMFTLEGVLSALVVLAGMAFALQAVVVTPTDGGAPIGSADGDRLEQILEEATENGSVKRAVLAWDGGAFDGTPSGSGYFVDGLPDNGLGTALRAGFDSSTSTNVFVHYESSSGPGTEPLAYNGAPESDAVRETVTVALYDQDSVYDESGDQASGTLESRGSGFFYVDDQHPATDLHAVVELEVVVW